MPFLMTVSFMSQRLRHALEAAKGSVVVTDGDMGHAAKPAVRHTRGA